MYIRSQNCIRGRDKGLLSKKSPSVVAISYSPGLTNSATSYCLG